MYTMFFLTQYNFFLQLCSFVSTTALTDPTVLKRALSILESIVQNRCKQYVIYYYLFKLIQKFRFVKRGWNLILSVPNLELWHHRNYMTLWRNLVIYIYWKLWHYDVTLNYPAYNFSVRIFIQLCQGTWPSTVWSNICISKFAFETWGWFCYLNVVENFFIVLALPRMWKSIQLL
jgi:hypothetical protein